MILDWQAALFSAVLTTFIIESYKNLQPDPQVEMMRAVLLQLQKSSNITSDNIPPPVAPFTLTPSAVRVNVYWFSSLILSLSAALITILAKQWVRYLLAGLSPVPMDQGRQRQFRADGLHKWKLPAVLSFLPLLIHVALLLFFAGLVDFIWSLDNTVAAVSATLIIATFLVYVATNVLSYIYPDCPFKTSGTLSILLAHELLKVSFGKLLRNARALSTGVHALVSHTFNFVHEEQTEADPQISERALSYDSHHSALKHEKHVHRRIRIASLRDSDERFISEHSDLLDTHVILSERRGSHGMMRTLRPRRSFLVRKLGQPARRESMPGPSLCSG